MTNFRNCSPKSRYNSIARVDCLGIKAFSSDTEDKVEFRNVREASAVLAWLTLRMATTDELPFTQKANEAIKAMLQQYGYDDVMKIHGSHPS